ncbi:hypothetical protein BT69DRAFT_1350619 [Atractiella rhizophila]|nr:hypothetical protein BT69DRAFT_1350619 [Atractiella rhizophila]
MATARATTLTRLTPLAKVGCSTSDQPIFHFEGDFSSYSSRPTSATPIAIRGCKPPLPASSYVGSGLENPPWLASRMGPVAQGIYSRPSSRKSSRQGDEEVYTPPLYDLDVFQMDLPTETSAPRPRSSRSGRAPTPILSYARRTSSPSSNRPSRPNSRARRAPISPLSTIPPPRQPPPTAPLEEPQTTPQVPFRSVGTTSDLHVNTNASSRFVTKRVVHRHTISSGSDVRTKSKESSHAVSVNRPPLYPLPRPARAYSHASPSPAAESLKRVVESLPPTSSRPTPRKYHSAYSFSDIMTQFSPTSFFLGSSAPSFRPDNQHEWLNTSYIKRIAITFIAPDDPLRKFTSPRGAGVDSPHVSKSMAAGKKRALEIVYANGRVYSIVDFAISTENWLTTVCNLIEDGYRKVGS